MEEIAWCGAGWLSLVLGGAIWAKLRDSQTPSAAALAFAIVAGHLAWNHGPLLWARGGLYRFVAIAFLFHCSSPIVAFWCFGFAGALRRWTFGSLVFLTLTVYASFMLGLRPAPGLESPLRRFTVAASLALLPFLWTTPFASARQVWQQWRSGRFQRRSLRRERRQKRQEERERKRQQRHEFWMARQRAKTEAQTERLKQSEQKNARKQDAKRQEILTQVRQLRILEVRRVQEGNEGLCFHPHFGFLLAEAARTLRLEIATGERVPPIENDTFLLEVVEHLLEEDAFAQRYFHTQGEQAIAAVNSYLSGVQPLKEAVACLGQLGLQPAQLAPTPLLGQLVPELVEAWLVPHRRWQEGMRQCYLQQQHPQQMAIGEFLGGADAPTPQQWRQAWDAAPWIFTAGDGSRRSRADHGRLA